MKITKKYIVSEDLNRNIKVYDHQLLKKYGIREKHKALIYTIVKSKHFQPLILVLGMLLSLSTNVKAHAANDNPQIKIKWVGGDLGPQDAYEICRAQGYFGVVFVDVDDRNNEVTAECRLEDDMLKEKK